MNRHWKGGIQPKKLTWIIKNKLAICEQVGGYSDRYRRVRRNVELAWIANQSFDCLISLLPTNQNIHNYKETGVPCIHYPTTGTTDFALENLVDLYDIITEQLNEGKKLLIHRDKVADFMAGMIAGYLLYSGKVKGQTQAINKAEELFKRRISTATHRLLAEISQKMESGAA